MPLTPDDVRHVAELARLELSPAEQALLLEQLSSILGHMELLNEVDTASILPTAQVIAATNVMRDDEMQPSLPRDQVLANAPVVEDGYFRVAAVLDAE